jgi:hypothetical protein
MTGDIRRRAARAGGARLGPALLSLALSTAGAAWADTVHVTATMDDEDRCVREIRVHPDPLTIECGDHVPWCGGSSSASPTVVWEVMKDTGEPAPSGYRWEVVHKPTSSATERSHFSSPIRFTTSTSPQAATLGGPSILKQGRFTWTYSVHALPDGDLGCDPAKKDPQVVFNGGGGYEPLLWLALGIAVALIAYYLLRRRPTRVPKPLE